MTVFRGSSDDQYIHGKSTAYATCRATAYLSRVAGALPVGQKLSSGYYYVYRSYVVFDTSALPDGATITAVSVGMKIAYISDNKTHDIYIYKYNWKAVPDGTGTGDDRDNVYDMGTAGATDAQAAAKETDAGATQAMSGKVAGDIMIFTGLTTAWVSKTGTTKYAFKSSGDVDNHAPIGQEYISFYSGDDGVENNRPYLEVTYTGSAGGQRVTRLFAQDVLVDTPFMPL
jgi:hypothetical protein